MSKSEQNPSHFPAFDGLRAIATLTVIGVHATFVSGFTGRSGIGHYTSRLEIGVAVFFVISGFLLYRPFAMDHFGGRPAPSNRSFWIRRLKRIVPAYWVAFLFVTYVLHADRVVHGWGSLLIYLGFAQIYVPSYVVTGISQAWSLCTEMTFYLALPLWAGLIGRHRDRRSGRDQLRVEVAGLAALVAMSFAFRIMAMGSHGLLAVTMPNWLPGYADLFALGMLLAVLSSWFAVEDRRPPWLWHPAVPWASWSLAAVAFVAVSNIGLPLTPITSSPVGVSLARQTLYGVFAFLVVLPAVFGPQDRGLIRRALQWRPVALVGVVSYGIYLWHEAWIELFLRWTGDRLFTIPLLDLLLPVTALAVAAAALSYVLVEKPVRQLKWPPRARPATAPGAPASPRLQSQLATK